MATCSYTTKLGRRCKNNVRRDGLCAVHYGIKKAQNSDQWTKAKQVGATIGAIAGGATAIMKLVEEAVKLWSSLPFGPMPSEKHYESLLRQIGPFWPEIPKSYTPRSKSHPDWARAEQLYNSARAIIEGGQEVNDSDLEEALNDWLLNLPDWFQEMIEERFGADFDSMVVS